MRVARGRGFAWASVGFVGLSASAFGAGSDVPDGSVVITGAQILAGITITGDTSDNTDFADSGVAPLSDCGVSTAPDEWYRIQIGGATGTIAIDVDGCGTLYDSKFFIRDSGASIVRCNDDGCGSGGGPSRLQNVVLAPGDYDLAIDGFLSESGAYEVVLREFVPLSCFLDPPCGGEPEGEPCDDVNDDTTNGGCLSTPNVFGTITIDGPAICGVTWANAGRRDTDWYAFSVAFPQLVVTHVRGEPDVVAFLLTMSAGGACPPIEVTHWPPAFSGACDTNQILDTFFQIDPGDYVLFVGPGTETGNPIFDGFPCPDGATSNNAYEVLISSAHHGSCCLENGQCLQGEDGVSLDFCSYVGGVYHGGVLCDVANCSGACCIESTCSDLEFDECLAAGGAYQGESTS
ncbi:MAG: hypothetical protein GY715_21375, partial [Planctomycetes bacterium]|nr:hypothetical protein [Planctomycetota bacterium]